MTSSASITSRNQFIKRHFIVSFLLSLICVKVGFTNSRSWMPVLVQGHFHFKRKTVEEKFAKNSLFIYLAFTKKAFSSYFFLTSYAKTPENADENGYFQNWLKSEVFWKRCAFKKFSFICRQVKNEAFKNIDEICGKYCHFHLRLRVF